MCQRNYEPIFELCHHNVFIVYSKLCTYNLYCFEKMTRILQKKHQDTLDVFYVHHQINIHTIIVCFAYCLHTHTFLNICSAPNHFSLWYQVYLLSQVQRFMCLSSHKTYIQDEKLVEVLIRSMRSRMSFHLYELLCDKILKKIKVTNELQNAKRSSKLAERII